MLDKTESDPTQKKNRPSRPYWIIPTHLTFTSPCWRATLCILRSFSMMRPPLCLTMCINDGFLILLILYVDQKVQLWAHPKNNIYLYCWIKNTVLEMICHSWWKTQVQNSWEKWRIATFSYFFQINHTFFKFQNNPAVAVSHHEEKVSLR